MMGKRLKFVKTAAAVMMQEPPQRQSENLGELLSSEELNNQTKGKGGSEQHHGEACLEFTQLSRLHLRHGMPFFFFGGGGEKKDRKAAIDVYSGLSNVQEMNDGERKRC